MLQVDNRSCWEKTFDPAGESHFEQQNSMGPDMQFAILVICAVAIYLICWMGMGGIERVPSTIETYETPFVTYWQEIVTGVAAFAVGRLLGEIAFRNRKEKETFSHNIDYIVIPLILVVGTLIYLGRNSFQFNAKMMESFQEEWPTIVGIASSFVLGRLLAWRQNCYRMALEEPSSSEKPKGPPNTPTIVIIAPPLPPTPPPEQAPISSQAISPEQQDVSLDIPPQNVSEVVFERFDMPSNLCPILCPFIQKFLSEGGAVIRTHQYGSDPVQIKNRNEIKQTDLKKPGRFFILFGKERKSKEGDILEGIECKVVKGANGEFSLEVMNQDDVTQINHLRIARSVHQIDEVASQLLDSTKGEVLTQKREGVGLSNKNRENSQQVATA